MRWVILKNYSLDREECGVKVLKLKTSLPANPLRFVLRDDPANLRVLLHLLECMIHINIKEQIRNVDIYKCSKEGPLNVDGESLVRML